MMGMRMPKTCWAVFKWQVINLRSCCIWMVDSVEKVSSHFRIHRWDSLCFSRDDCWRDPSTKSFPCTQTTLLLPKWISSAHISYFPHFNLMFRVSYIYPTPVTFLIRRLLFHLSLFCFRLGNGILMWWIQLVGKLRSRILSTFRSGATASPNLSTETIRPLTYDTVQTTARKPLKVHVTINSMRKGTVWQANSFMGCQEIQPVFRNPSCSHQPATCLYTQSNKSRPQLSF